MRKKHPLWLSRRQETTWLMRSGTLRTSRQVSCRPNSGSNINRWATGCFRNRNSPFSLPHKERQTSLAVLKRVAKVELLSPSSGWESNYKNTCLHVHKAAVSGLFPVAVAQTGGRFPQISGNPIFAKTGSTALQPYGSTIKTELSNSFWEKKKRRFNGKVPPVDQRFSLGSGTVSMQRVSEHVSHLFALVWIWFMCLAPWPWWSCREENPIP